MATVVHRTTVEVRYSVNTPDFDSGTWIINPNLSALSGILNKYWKVSGNDVLEMTQGEKDTVDTDEQAAIDAANEVVEHADNAAAVTAGLSIGARYRTGDAAKAVHS